jgi:hypothetical protein
MPRALSSCLVWKREEKRRAVIRTALSPNPAAVLCDDPLNRGETDARAGKLFLAVQPLEGAEQSFRVLHLEPCTIVLYEEDRLAGFSFSRTDFDTRVRVFST